MSPAYDAAVIGAGPYGLSAAAHLRGRGLKTAVFGTPMGMWREHMPRGMLLRSHTWATNLSDPHRRSGIERFFEESKYQNTYPLPIEAFVEYGLWFQQREVPDVDRRFVASIERRDNGFLLTLEDGCELEAAAVVMAIGLLSYAVRPEIYTALPAHLASHSSEHQAFGRFNGRKVLVVGGGQSAIEFAALLTEAGAVVEVVARRPIWWLAPDRTNERSIVERLLAPRASIAPGWQNWALDRLPYLFYRAPQRKKDAYNSYYMSGASSWLRERVIGKATVRENSIVTHVDERDGRLRARFPDGEAVDVDHILLATGYKVNLDRLTMLHPELRSCIRVDDAIPALSPRFESSVPNLYFLGLTSLRAFGPLYRFVAGCDAAARRVARSIDRARS